MRAGSVPSSISVNSRSVSTLVLPVPAEAATQTEAARMSRAAAAGRVRAGPHHSSPSLRPTPFEMVVIRKARPARSTGTAR